MFIIITLLGFQISAASLKISGERVVTNLHEYILCTDCPSLIPVIPIVASYEDQNELVSLMRNESLSPTVPMEADFEDSPTRDSLESSDIMPRVPVTADFDDLP